MSLTSSRNSSSRSVNARSRARAPNVNGFVCGIALCILAYARRPCMHSRIRRRRIRREPCLGLDQHAAGLDPRRVHGGAEGRLVEADAGLEVELPAVPRAAQDAAAGELVDTRAARHPLPHGPEAERPAVVRAAVADPVQGAVRLRDDPDLAPRQAGDDVAVALQVGGRADVVPLSHASWAGRGARRTARPRSRAGPWRASPPAGA